MSDRAPQNQDKYVLRLPDGMRDRIKRSAEANNRSMNAEIVATLEEKYPAEFSDEEILEMISAFSQTFAQRRGVASPSESAENRKFLLAILRYRLRVSDPDSTLAELESRDVRPDVSLGRLLDWMDEMERFLNALKAGLEAQQASADR